MKKSIRIVAIIMIVCVAAIALSACRGASAYEIAVKNGYEGTEQQWLATLVGKNGNNGKDGKDGKDYEGAYDAYDLYLTAVESGEFTGTFGEFIETYFSGTEAASTSVIAKCMTSSCSVIASSPISPSGSTTYASAGSGIVYSIDKESGTAYFVTNYHVVYNSKSPLANHIAENIRVFFYENQYKSGAITCEYVGGSILYDLAVLKVTNSDIVKNSTATAVTFADSEDLTLGETVYAIGNSEAEGISVTKGILSVESEYIKLSSDEIGTFEIRVLRYDAAVSPGNSGGGVFDAQGDLVAICNSKTSKEDTEGMNYGIPANVIDRIVGRIRYYCEGTSEYKVKKPLLGVTVSVESSKAIYNTEKARVDIIEEVRVSEINEDSSVKGMLEVDDKLLSFTHDGTTSEITSLYQLTDYLLKLYPGDLITLTVMRGGEVKNVEITITQKMMIDVE